MDRPLLQVCDGLELTDRPGRSDAGGPASGVSSGVTVRPVGFIALFGVAVLNGLVLHTAVERLRAGGMEAREAAVQGARERPRPA